MRSPSSSGLLEYPQYTRPATFRGWSVPDVLLSGDHARIGRWRRAQALWRTRSASGPTWSTAAGGLSDDEALLAGLVHEPDADAEPDAEPGGAVRDDVSGVRLTADLGRWLIT